MVRLSLEGFGLTALGSYMKPPGRSASLFVFGAIDAPIGGPPYCFVRGVAAGMGFNSALRMPSTETAGDFSLVRAAQGAEGFGTPSLIDILAAMGEDVKPKAGAQWLAAGIRFTSFEIVSSVALLAVVLDGAPRIGLVGLSRASMPPMSSDPIAYIELGLVAQVDPAAGLLAVEGEITRNSFVLAHACRPTGGFAFYSWFAGPHEGDFVLTVGGYHPRFEVPAHYPRVPRMQILWRLSSNLQIKGTSYFALTPNAVMAGGGIEVVWASGDLSAWFSADYDFLIYWKPFRYFVDIAISVGASLRINLLFTSYTLTVHVGAALHLHGPPFGGEAWVDLSIISFTIPFGDSAPHAPPLSWAEFKQAFLPAPGACRGLQRPIGDADGVTALPTQTICSLRIIDGLTRELTGDPGYIGPPRYLVNPERFAAASSSLIPSKTARFNGTAVDGSWTSHFGVTPMGVAESAIRSTHHLRFEERVGKDGWIAFTTGISPVIGSVPAALWLGSDGSRSADATGPDLGGQRLVEGTLLGFSLRPAVIPPDVSRPTTLDELLFEDLPDKTFDWLEPGRTDLAPPPPPAGEPAGRLTIVRAGGSAIVNENYILKALGDADIAARRAAVIAALTARGGRTRGEVDVVAMASRTALTDWPRVGALGRTT
ncbi:MAG: hypothetical protein JO339_41895, partial [Alphaproteobacteria bacterium]|nr:hypothetical protein [Alphaproteobacteria bacterium]